MAPQLDADAQRLLAQWAATTQGPIEHQPLDALRGSGLVNPDVTGPPPVLPVVEDRAVVSQSGEPIPVRVYAPTDAPGAPVIVYAHGGGWTLLSIDAADVLCRHLALGTGCTVVSVGYRLAPEHPFPAAFDDMWDVTGWASSGGLGWTPPSLCVAGDSAGGNLAAAVAVHAVVTGRIAVDLQLLLYPATSTEIDTESMRSLGADPRFRLTPGVMRWAWQNYLGPDLSISDYRAVPARAADFAGVARAIVVTPEFDPIKDDGRNYAELLRDAGVEVDLIVPEGLPHGFGMMLGAIPRARLALDDVIARVCEALRPSATARAAGSAMRDTPGVRKINLEQLSFTYDDADPAGYRAGAARLGPAIGAVKMGATVYELQRGESICPYHYEIGNEEWAIVLAGRPTLRHPGGEEVLEQGDVVCFPDGPDGAHKLTNHDDEPVQVMLLSDKQRPVVAVYPDSDKVGVYGVEGEPGQLFRRGSAVEYYDGEA